MRQETVIHPLALERLKRTLGSKADQLLSGIINTFSLDGEQFVELMHRSLAERDQAELIRAAHTMKSTAATFGADNLSAMARELEERARRGEIDGNAELVRQIEVEFERARLALEEWKGK